MQRVLQIFSKAGHEIFLCELQRLPADPVKQDQDSSTADLFACAVSVIFADNDCPAAPVTNSALQGGRHDIINILCSDHYIGCDIYGCRIHFFRPCSQFFLIYNDDSHCFSSSYKKLCTCNNSADQFLPMYCGSCI